MENGHKLCCIVNQNISCNVLFSILREELAYACSCKNVLLLPGGGGVPLGCCEIWHGLNCYPEQQQLVVHLLISWDPLFCKLLLGFIIKTRQCR